MSAVTEAIATTSSTRVRDGALAPNADDERHRPDHEEVRVERHVTEAEDERRERAGEHCTSRDRERRAKGRRTSGDDGATDEASFAMSATIGTLSVIAMFTPYGASTVGVVPIGNPHGAWRKWRYPIVWPQMSSRG